MKQDFDKSKAQTKAPQNQKTKKAKRKQAKGESVKKFITTMICAIACAGALQGEDVYAIFNTKAVQDSNLTLDSSGTIDKIHVDVGSVVKKGDELLSLANSDKAAQLQAVKEQYIFAKKQYERYQKSKSVVDKNTLDQYYSNYKKLEADYDYYQSLYNRSILKAPFAGTIAEKKIELGDGVNANNTILFRLVSHEKKILIQFDSKYANIVRPGDVFEFYLGGDGIKRTTTITKIYPTINESTRKVSAEAMIDDSIKPGIFGDGFIKPRADSAESSQNGAQNANANASQNAASNTNNASNANNTNKNAISNIMQGNR
ncbi:hypothetical protein BKN38_04020 [Helicobacter sp. CLO-3]|nr:hypothetical protein BA723_04920 [Helicobacter sp. CLO-3]OHU84083.1 hypothetical protein BKN38_04020 [Helicobacter sp. CLO-3]